jgi:hypothetical protein
LNCRFVKPETNAFCLRAMGGAIVVFDLTESHGAFRKKSPVHVSHTLIILSISSVSSRDLYDHICFVSVMSCSVPQIKKCCELLCSSPLDVACARNAVRYSTKHFDDADTPEAIKNLFE